MDIEEGATTCSGGAVATDCYIILNVNLSICDVALQPGLCYTKYWYICIGAVEKVVSDIG